MNSQRLSRSYRFIVSALFVGSVLTALAGHPETSYAVMAAPEQQQEAAKLFDRWNASLQTGNPDEVVKNYAPDAVLLPTVSNKVRRNHAEIRDYFVNFLKLKPQGTINERNVHYYGNVMVDSGIYTFTILKDNKPTEVRARYTFVYRKVGDEWLISEHHSSAMPEHPEQEIASLFDRWNASLQTGNPDEVVKNYAADAILLPTVSNRVRHNHNEIRDYFVQFLKLQPQGIINERTIHHYGDVAVDSGSYTFNIVKDATPTQVQARYTFVYHKQDNGNWLISEHHSSVMPEPTKPTN